ncbi:MAG TPA: hypothetical protein VMT73_10770 [Anaerolineales bacterium]|nr:hypothetical protein [Anaerolineales bacterium]
MSFEYDEKGKFFTNVVSKFPVSALVQTTTHLIRGTIHIRQGERVKDELDHDELFLAVTDASVIGPNGEVLYAAPFLAVRRNQIVWLLPESDGDSK